MNQPVRFGPYRLDPRRGLRRGNREVRLPPRVHTLLDLLLDRAGEVIPKDELFRAVWPDAVVSDAALTSCVQQLRRALEDDARAPRYIETLHRRGYRFIARVIIGSRPGSLPGTRHWPRRPGEPPSTSRHPRNSTFGGTVGDHDSLVGRAAELDRLMGLARASASGQLYAAAIIGEAGVGKTRLLNEVGRLIERDGGRVVTGHAYESEQIVPYGPWIEGIAASGVLADAGVTGTLPYGSRAALARLFPGLWDAGPLAGPEHHRTLFEALAVLLRRLAERPLLLALEDVHCADEMSVRLLLFLVRRLHDTPVLALVTVREEEIAASPLIGMLLDELQREASFVRLALSPLSRPETMVLVRGMARARDAVDDSVLEVVWRTSEGNPLVAIETIRGLDEGAISPVASALSVPSRIQELITARLQRLAEPARALTLTAAVIDRPFEFRLVQHASALPEADAANAIEMLVQRRVLKVIDDRLAFGHERIRHAVLAGMLPGRRVVLHAAVARSLAHVYAGRLEPHHAAIAVHAKEGGLLEMAADHFRTAGRQALARYARREAVECFREALAAIDALPDSAERTAVAFDVRIELRSALRWLGELREVTRLLGESEVLAERLGDRRRSAWIDAYRTNDAFMRGRPGEGLGPGRRAYATAVELGDAPLLATAGLYTGLCLFGVGDYRLAARSLERAAALAGEANRREVLLWVGPPPLIARGLLALVLGELGEFDRGAKVGRQALAAAEADHLPYCCVQAGECLAWLHLIRGDREVAWDLLESAARVAREWEVRVLSPPTQAGRGYCLALSGRVGEGLALLEAARQEAEAIRLSVPPFLNWLGEAYLMDGQSRHALELGRISVRLAREQGERGVEAWAHRLLGESRMDHSIRDETAAGTHFLDALALATERGMRPLIAHCRLGLAKLYQRAGKRHEAREHLTTATTMCRDMGMTYWLEKSETEMRELR